MSSPSKMILNTIFDTETKRKHEQSKELLLAQGGAFYGAHF